jgi:hypothetical protein
VAVRRTSGHWREELKSDEHNIGARAYGAVSPHTRPFPVTRDSRNRRKRVRSPYPLDVEAQDRRALYPTTHQYQHQHQLQSPGCLHDPTREAARRHHGTRLLHYSALRPPESGYIWKNLPMFMSNQACSHHGYLVRRLVARRNRRSCTMYRIADRSFTTCTFKNVSDLSARFLKYRRIDQATFR